MTETAIHPTLPTADASIVTLPGRSLCYVLITPARNEEAFIEGTIRSVIAQTHLPERWIIVSDGSTDRTDEIVNKYVGDHPWIELLRMPERKDRSFGGKVHCFDAAYERVKHTEFDIVGNLDADITFDAEYFEFLLGKFDANSQLGVAGTPFVEVEDEVSYDFRFTAIEHVSGACQMFRRKCYEQIGGYVPVKAGGIDWIAVTSARMHGWKTRTFVEKVCHHHRTMGTASASKLMANFKLGRQDYYLGGHPLWQLFRGLYQMVRKPYLVGGALLLAGYGWSWATRVERPVSAQLVKFHRAEQMRRLRSRLFGGSAQAQQN